MSCAVIVELYELLESFALLLELFELFVFRVI